jgi:pilus assembly protein FimV
VTSRASRDTTSLKKFTPTTLVSAVFIALASMSVQVDAAGLGRLTVQSGLGQPLRAEVEVTSLTREESQSLSARLASAEAFRQAGLEFNPALQNLRFAIEPRDGRTFVRITSTQPINEPFVDLLLELNWATGKFVREYTFLLDPPEVRTAREGADSVGRRDAVQPQAAAPAPAAPVAVAPVATPAAPLPSPTPPAPVPPAAESAAPPVAAAPAQPVATPAQTPAAPATPAPRPAAARAPSERLSPVPAERPRPAAQGATAGSVDVKRGDTLGNIARAVRPEGVSLEQAMIAIYRANPSAFIANNINLVREGARLNLPDAAAMAAVDGGEATREVRMQSQDFAQYRQRLAAAPRQLDAPRSGRSAAGTVGGRVQDRAAGATGGDQLLLSRPGTGATGGGAVGAQGGSGSSAERAVARDAALREARSRVTELERNVADLQKLLELKNQSLADVQRQLEAARSGSSPVTGQVGSAAKPEPVKPAPPAVTEAPKAEAPKAEAPKAEAPKVEPPKADTAAPAPVPVPPPAPVAQAPKPPPVPAAPAASGGFLDDLLANPFLLPGVGGVALLGAGYGWYALRRRRKVEKFEDSLIAADGFASNSLFGSTGGQSVDTSSSAFTAAAGATGDVQTTEVDPIAEADVYIAYGREAQAEEILKEALKRQPERQAIRAKLLDIYAGRKDVKAFGSLAREMHDMTDGRNEEWPKVATLGASIDPGNPLYGGAAPPVAGAAAAAAAGLAAAMPADAGAARADAAPSRTAVPQPAKPTADDMPSLDFDLNLDTRIDRDAGSDGGAAAGRGAAPGRQDDPAAGLDERFDLPSLDLGNKTASAPEASPLDLDLPALESLTQTRLPPADEAMDVSPINLDLEPATVGADSAEAAAGGAGRWQEMATKLDLASAYEEIGDKEGARELLQEVLKGGDASQQQRARAMLGKIG